MRLASAPILKSAVLYGLLAVAHALPASISLEDEERRSLDRRMVPVRPVTPKPAAKPPPGHPDGPSVVPDAPGGTPHDSPDGAPPAVRPGTDPVVPSTGDDVRLGQAAPKDPAVSGAKNIKALDDKLKESPITSKDFADYDAKIGKYTPDVYPAEKDAWQITDPDTAKWYKDNGVPVGDGTPGNQGPELTGIDIYGAKVDLDAPGGPDLPPAWSGAVDPVNGVMTRNGEFRKGSAGSMDSEHYYRDIPEDERIFISDIIARNWADNGGGKPMTKNVVTGIVSDDMKPYLTKLLQDKGKNPVEITSTDPEWPAIMGGSAGAPLARALTDHPDVFHNYKPTSVSVHQKGDGMIDAIFSLGPGVST